MLTHNINVRVTLWRNVTIKTQLKQSFAHTETWCYHLWWLTEFNRCGTQMCGGRIQWFSTNWKSISISFRGTLDCVMYWNEFSNRNTPASRVWEARKQSEISRLSLVCREMLADFYLAFNISACIIDGFKGGMIKYKEWHGGVCRAACGMKTSRTLSLNTTHTYINHIIFYSSRWQRGYYRLARGTVTNSQPRVS